MMQHLKRLIPIMLLASTSAHAQFYAPETEFHDKAQRLFVVEATRVLAWRENLKGARISDVTYHVTVDTNRVVTWEVDCVDTNGLKLRHLQVRYPEKLLLDGPQFYRDSFRQIWSQGKWTAASSNLTTAELTDRYWAGSELNGMAREDGLRAAFRLVGSNWNEGRQAPELAGLLANLPMPSLCGGFTIDATSLARGAVWLAFSESMLTGTNSASNECWAPILFMAGRENVAVALWKSQVKPDQGKQKAHVLFEWWDFFLSRPKARAAFEFAAESRQRTFAMPLMTYYSRLQNFKSTLVEVVVTLYGGNPREFVRLHNYGAFFAVQTDVSGGRLLEGAWPALFRAEWIKTLNAFQPSALDYTGYVQKLQTVKLSDPLRSSASADDLSLVNLEQVAPLLQIGYEQGTGSLIPVAAVTARDLLNYGWEMNGFQMGSRYRFVNFSWGIHDLARTIYQRAMRGIEGQAPFFPGTEQAKIFNLQETLFRLQMVDDLGWRVEANVQPFAKDPTDPTSARLFYKRCWVRPYEVRWEAWCLAKSNLGGEMLDILRRYHAECGPKSDVVTVEYLQNWSNAEIRNQPGLADFKEKVAESFPEPTALQVSALKRYAFLPSDSRALVYEQMFWENPNCELHYKILNNYIIAGAWNSAKRFYKQMREIVNKDVGFSNSAASKAWVIGFLTADESLMALALEDSDSGSYIAMMTHVWNGAAHEDWNEVQRQLTEIIGRYEQEKPPDSEAKKMKGFIPLVPALKDPNHARHAEALDYFGKSDAATIFRWILIQKLKLSKEDAIRLLGGKETDRARRVMIMKLENADPKQMNAAFMEYAASDWSNGGLVVTSWVSGQKPEIIEDIAEKPMPNVKRIEQAVAEKVEKQQR